MNQSIDQNIGLCKLCQNEDTLCQKSHIIPKKIWDYVKGEEKNAWIFTKENKPSQTQNGLHEPNILCNCCEQIIGSYEKYGQELIKKLENNQYDSNIIMKDKIKYFQINDYDYINFKLFLLSILFKISISNQDFYSNLSLGKWENKLRSSILSNNPGEKYDFATCIRRFEGKEAYLITNPVRSRYGSINYCEYRLANYFVIIKVDKRKNDKLNNRLFNAIILSPESSLIIQCIDYKQTGDYRDIVHDIDTYKTR